VDISELRRTTTDLIGPRLDRLSSLAALAAVVGLVLTAIGIVMGLVAPPAAHADEPGGHGVTGPLVMFFHAYLHGYMFWFGVTAGSLGLLMLHHVVGGGWGFILRRMLEAGVRLLPIVAVLFIPIAVGLFMGQLYPWVTDHPDAIMQAKAPYLNIPFFLIRAVVAFGILWILGQKMLAWGETQNHRADPDVSRRLNVLGAAGILIYMLLMTFVSVDWVMSLDPHWFSSIFGLLTAAGQALATLALMLCLLGWLARDTPLVQAFPGYFRDLGNLMLAMVLLWAYLSFSQFLIYYSGNLVETVPWYLRRMEHGWGLIPGALIILHFALPFAVLLVRSDVKRDPQLLGKVAALIVAARFLDYFWWVAPQAREQLSIGFADVGAPMLLGGIWLYFWASFLRDRPVVPLHDPRFIEHFTAEHQSPAGHASGPEVVHHG
jgi:hypothetical protein